MLLTSLLITCKMKMTVSAAAANNGSESPSRSGFRLTEKLGKLHVFSVDRTHRWPVQGWSSGDESPLELDEQFVAEEGARASRSHGGPCRAGASSTSLMTTQLPPTAPPFLPAPPSPAAGLRASRSSRTMYACA